MAPLTEPAFARLRSVDPVLAEAAGDAAFELETDLFAALGLAFAARWVGVVLTGLFASRGANYVSDLLKKLQGLGKKQE